MTVKFGWSPGSPFTLIPATSLNALTDGAWVNPLALGGATYIFDNTTGTTIYGDAELILGTGVSIGSSGGRVDLYQLSSQNGTTFPSPGTASAAIHVKHRVDSFVPVSSTTYIQDICKGIVMPPGKHAFAINAKLGTNWPSTGCSLILYPYTEQAG